MRDGPIVIVGAGVAGLAAAIDCAAAGRAVTVVERAATPGGKIAAATVAGRAIDCGPTVLTMLPVFEALFADAGADLAAALPVERATILARHGWSGGAMLDLHADPERTTQAIGDFAGAADARGYRSFARAAGRIHDALADTFMAAEKPAQPLALLWRGGLAGLPGFLTLDPYRSLARMAAAHFRDPRLVQLFGRYATYCGGSPYRTPATLALVADVEARGVWRVAGGMTALPEAMAALATRLGARLRCGEAVAEMLVEHGRAAGVRLAGGERIAGAQVILTADAAALAAGLFGAAAARGRRPLPAAQRSYSAVTIAAMVRSDAPLAHHNIAFADDGPAEFAALDRGVLPADPTVYVCAQDRGAGDDAPAPAGPERVLLVLNAPADGDWRTLTPAEIERCTKAAFTRLARSGLTLSIPAEPAGACSISTPSDFERRFPATGGALYGRASHGWTASFRRPGARTAVPGLWLAGGSVHPGAGVPMAALSGRIAARAALAAPARGSTWLYRRAAMPGGTPTPSPTTAATA